jgi:hypothetical protein
MESLLPESKTIACDIVLLPSEDQAQLAIQASQHLSQQGSLFMLDDKNLYAHASLYMFQMDIANQEECIAALQEIAAGNNIQRLEQNGFFYQNSGHYKGYVNVSFARNKEVDLLQEQVLAAFNDLRADTSEKNKQKMITATGLQLEYLQKYGYASIGDLFRPHLTLTRFPIEIEPDLTSLLPSKNFTGEFTRLGLVEVGPHGTSIRKIADFYFGS